jgi:hypothetical protein
MNSKTSICDASSTTRDRTGMILKRPQVSSIGFESMHNVDKTRVIPSNSFSVSEGSSLNNTSDRITACFTSSYNSSCLHKCCMGIGNSQRVITSHHSKMKSFDTKSTNLTPFLNSVSAMFFTPIFDCAIIQHGALRSTHVAAAAAMVVVFPVPGGPV